MKFTMAVLLLQNEIITLKEQVKEFDKKIPTAKNEIQSAFLQKGKDNVVKWIGEFEEAITLLNNAPSDEVSDTTEADSSNADGNKILSSQSSEDWKEKFRKKFCSANNTEYFHAMTNITPVINWIEQNVILPLQSLQQPPQEETESVFTEPITGYGERIPLQAWKELVESKCFIDYDGFGRACDGDLCTKKIYYPSQIDLIPEGTKYIIWYNK